jgi:hypothetical protein
MSKGRKTADRLVFSTKEKVCQINITITSQEVEYDCCFDVVILPSKARETMLIAARGAVEALREEGIKAEDLTT